MENQKTGKSSFTHLIHIGVVIRDMNKAIARLTALGIGPTRCIDDRLLGRLFGGTWPAEKDPGQRPHCRCVPSRDIGIPDTCTLGCLYCYTTRSDELARRRRSESDPDSPSLWGRYDAATPSHA